MNATKRGLDARGEDAGPVRAVIYARTATANSPQSINRQCEVALRYALRHNLDVIRTYADIGKSGSTIDDRDEMKRLLKDVMSPDRDFVVILICDLSRWGRFLDMDESAYCERLCHLAGVEIHVCHEQAEKDSHSTSDPTVAARRAVRAYGGFRFLRSRRNNLRQPSRPVSQNNEWRRPWKRHFRGRR